MPAWAKVAERRWRLHCLSAFTASVPTYRIIEPFTNCPLSPLPFGVHRFGPGRGQPKGSGASLRSPLPFGVHRFGPHATAPSRRESARVSIAFRRSPLRSRPAQHGHPTMASGLHCLSAFTASVPSFGGCRPTLAGLRLHCLSAFTASVPRVHQGADFGDSVSIAFRRSPLRSPSTESRRPESWPKGLHCLSAFTASVPGLKQGAPAPPPTPVSIAFRRSPLRSHRSG